MDDTEDRDLETVEESYIKRLPSLPKSEYIKALLIIRNLLDGDPKSQTDFLKPVSAQMANYLADLSDMVIHGVTVSHALHVIEKSKLSDASNDG